MPTLQLTRDSGFADLLRAYKVLIDGEDVGVIRNGQCREFEVSAGSHALEVRIDWCTTGEQQFTAHDSPEVFRVFSKLRGWRFLFSGGAMFNPNGWIGLERSDTNKTPSEQAVTTTTSRSVSMIFRDHNPNPVIDARPRW